MPVLETPRLSMRPVAMSDFEAIHRLHTDPLVVQSLFSGEPPSRESTGEKVELYVRDWQQNGFGFFSVFLRGNLQEQGEFAGRAGLRRFEDTSDVEYGLCLFGHIVGRGLGPELGRAILRHAFEELGLERVVALIRPENERAVRAAQKIGFSHVEDRRYGDHVKGFYDVRPSQYGVALQSSGPGRHAS